MKKNIVSGLILFAALFARAQSGAYAIPWSTLDSGGGAISGGRFALHGTIGQPDAGAMSGGAFTHKGGYWGGLTEPAPRLSIRFAAGNRVALSWPFPSTGFVLEETSALAAQPQFTVWTAVMQTPVVVGANKEVTLFHTNQTRIYRLRKP